MGMGAPKQGSTLPPQGGKGGVQQPVRPQVPAQGGKGGVQQPVQPQSPYTPIGAQGGKGNMPLPPGVQMPIGLPPSQVPAQGGFPQRDLGYGNPPPRPTVPAQGGKAQNPDGTYTGNLGIPPQGGKGTSRQDYDRMMAQVSFAAGTTPPTYEEFVQNRLNPKPMPQVMPQKPGVPAQGGKAPLTPEQIAAIAPNIDPVRPMPQVQQPAPLGLNLGNMLYGGGGQQPQVMPQKPGTPAPGLNGVPGNQNPRYFGPGKPAPSPAQVMPRPMPQVMPRQPTPKPAPQGLAQIQQMLRGRR
jgi:hypothetical protein